MTDYNAKLKEFTVNENKVWFTGGYWPEGVPKQIYDIPDTNVLPQHEAFMKEADRFNTWDKDICIFVLGPYIERVKLKTLNDYAKKFGTFLHNLGIKQGDVVAIDLPNSPNFVVAYMGCQYIGATAQGINPTYRPMELLHSLTMTDAKVFVMMDALYIAGPNSILPKTKVEHVISTNLLDFVTVTGDAFDALRANIPSFQDKVPDQADQYKVYRMKNVIEQTQPKEIKVDIDPWTDPAVFLMTGGNNPKPDQSHL